MENRERNLLTLRYGAMTFGIFILLSIVLSFVGGSLALSQNILFILLAAEIYFCNREFKAESGVELDFKKAFAIGLQVSFFAGLLNAILVVVVILFAGNEAVSEALYKSKGLIYQGKDEQMFKDLVKVISNPYFMGCVTILFYLIIGIFISTLVALLVKGSTFQGNDEK